jgi:hypothetical protein
MSVHSRAAAAAFGDAFGTAAATMPATVRDPLVEYLSGEIKKAQAETKKVVPGHTLSKVEIAAVVSSKLGTWARKTF